MPPFLNGGAQLPGLRYSSSGKARDSTHPLPLPSTRPLGHPLITICGPCSHVVQVLGLRRLPGGRRLHWRRPPRRLLDVPRWHISPTRRRLDRRAQPSGLSRGVESIACRRAGRWWRRRRLLSFIGAPPVIGIIVPGLSSSVHGLSNECLPASGLDCPLADPWFCCPWWGAGDAHLPGPWYVVNNRSRAWCILASVQAHLDSV